MIQNFKQKMNNTITGLKKFTFLFFLSLINLGAIAQNASPYSTTLIVTDIHNAAVKQKMETGASALLTELNMAYFENRLPSLNKITGMSQEGRSALLAMWEMAPFRCIETEIIEIGAHTPTGLQIRNIPIYLKDMPDEDAYKEIAVNFDNSGNIEDIYFTLEMHQYQSIMYGDGNEVTDLRHRQAILNFIENFRTAYNTKDLDLIGKVYSEDALIRTGKVIKQSKRTDIALENSGFSKEVIDYQIYNKKEYINNLTRVFNNNARINVNFDQVEVVRHPKYDEIYGVTLKQGWNSTNYSDVGWLLLIIDFKDGENMLIHVRTWQPEMLNGKQLEEDERYQLWDFNIK